MSKITTIEELESLYGPLPTGSVVDKIADRLTPLYWAWISRARFCVLTTVGPEGTDGSPRGDSDPVVVSPDPGTLLLPDWRGNNLLDSLRNIVRDGRVSLMFMVPGAVNVIRVNGRATLHQGAICAQFERSGIQPRSVIRVAVEQVYVQCARAIMRADLWSGRDESADLPSVGELVREQQADFDAEAYDAAWPARAAQTMW